MVGMLRNLFCARTAHACPVVMSWFCRL